MIDVSENMRQAGEWAIVAAACALADDRRAMLISVSVTCPAAEVGAAYEQIQRAESEAARLGLDVETELTAHGVKIRFRRLPNSRRQH